MRNTENFTWYQSKSFELLIRNKKNKGFSWAMIWEAQASLMLAQSQGWKHYHACRNNSHYWAITVHIYRQGKGKDNYIAGEAKQPVKSDPNHAKWKLKEQFSDIMVTQFHDKWVKRKFHVLRYCCIKYGMQPRRPTQMWTKLQPYLRSKATYSWKSIGTSSRRRLIMG